MYKSKFTGEQIDQACTNANVPFFHEAYAALIYYDQMSDYIMGAGLSDVKYAVLNSMRPVILDCINSDIEVYAVKPLSIRRSRLMEGVAWMFLALLFADDAEVMEMQGDDLLRLYVKIEDSEFRLLRETELNLEYWNEYSTLELGSSVNMFPADDPAALEMISKYGHGIIASQYSNIFDLSNPDGCKDIVKWISAGDETSTQERLYPIFYIDNNYYKSHQRSSADAAYIFYFGKQKELCKVTISKEDGSFTLEDI